MHIAFIVIFFSFKRYNIIMKEHIECDETSFF